jgi:Secretion system C-terminal sorting domain
MLKQLFLGIVALSMLYAHSSKAQGRGCGVSPEYFVSKIKYPGGPTSIVVPSSFPVSAIDTCGHFAFYYEDKRIAGLGGPAAGFADATSGPALRSTMCAVVTYIETVFDFSGIDPTEKIRIYVDTSYSAVLKPITLDHVPGWGQDYGVGSAYYDGSSGTGVVSGFVEKFIKTGTDPNPGDYHGTFQMNFHRATSWPPIISAGKSGVDWYDWSNYYVGTGTATYCEPDFFQRALHTMGHILGFAAFHSMSLHHGTPSSGGPLFTEYEDRLYSGGDPRVTPSYFSTLIPARSGSGLLAGLWANNKANSANYPMFEVHFEEHDFYRQRMSPGDYQPYVMGTVNNWGTMKREFTKGDLDVFLNNIGLPAHPTTFSTSGTYASLFNNHLPYSDKMASMAYSAQFGNKSGAEHLPADYTLVNNTGASLTIDLTTLTADLHDADGDPITIMDGSLVNLRGCGQGGNNHALLTVNGAKNAITYTPREDYYGRSQFGFNLWDGKEKGAFVIFTIDVRKGSAVSIPKGDNIVLSGDFEEGSEVRMLANPVNNFSNQGYWIGKLGRLNNGQHFADSHPFDCYSNEYGNAIRKSYEDCNAISAGFGNAFVSFPWTGGGVAFGDASTFRVGEPEESPNAYFPPGVTKNDRYMLLGEFGSLLYLGEQVQHCKTYKLEFDIRHRFALGELSYRYGDTTNIYIGFTDSSHLVDPITLGTYPFFSNLTYNQLLPRYKTIGVTGSAWKHETLYFTYCSDNPSNILYFGLDPSQGGGQPLELIDNISIKEMDEIPLSVNIASEQPSRCQAKLTASDIINGCQGITFEWRIKGTGTLLATGREFSLQNPVMPTVYEVTVFDGCHTVKGEIELQPCPCSAWDVFGGAPITEITAIGVATDLSPGYYYLDHNIAITTDVTFDRANVLIEPGVTISVWPSAKLTIDNSHLFTCPDTAALWKGIWMESTGPFMEGGSARIEVRNNSLIEDAEVAISAHDLKQPPPGEDIIRITNSTFNRNLIGVSTYKAYSTASAGVYPITIYGNLFTSRLFDKTSMIGYPNTWHSTTLLTTEYSAGLTNTKAPFHISREFDSAYAKNWYPATIGIEMQSIGTTFGSGSSYSEVEVGRSGEQLRYNLIDNMQTGIHSRNSNMSINNTHIINIFKRMVPDDILPYTSSEGCGILARCDGPTVNRIRTGASNQKLKLYDCFRGVKAENMADVNFQQLVISSSHKLGGTVVPGAASSTELYAGEGIRVNGNNNHIRWSILNNTISNIHSGIAVFINNPKMSATTSISSNTLSARNPDPRFTGLTSLQYMMQAVDVYATWAPSGRNTLDINNNVLTEVFNGIHNICLWSTTPQITGNSISLADKTASTGSEQFGISIENSDDILVRSNTLAMTSGTLSATGDKIKGVYAAFSPTTTVCANSATNIGRSYEFAQLTPQPGTIWAGNTMQNAWKGFALGSPIGDQLIISGINRPGGNQWLGSWGAGKLQTYASVPSSSSKLSVRTLAAENPTVNDAFPFSNIYTSSGTPTILYPGTSVYNCISGTILAYDNKDLLRKVISDNLGVGIPASNSWMAQYNMYRAGIMDSVLRDSIPTLDTFISAAINSRYAWLTNLETALVAGNLTLAQTLLNNPVSALGRISVSSTVVVNDITGANSVVDNYLTYFNIYRRFLNNTITGSDSAELEMLSLKCPSVDGGAVYQARGLLHLLTGIAEEYNDDSCRYNQGFYRVVSDATEDGQQAYSLYPNPNQGSFTIRQNVAEDHSVRLKIYNALGMEVYQGYSTFKAGRVAVSMGEPMPGLYLLCIDDGKEKNTCLRFIIK